MVWPLSGTFPYLPVTAISSGGVWAKAGETASGASPTQHAPIIARVRAFVIILSHNVVPGSWLLTFERGWCSEMTYRAAVQPTRHSYFRSSCPVQIGRASGRERVCQYV